MTTNLTDRLARQIAGAYPWTKRSAERVSSSIEAVSDVVFGFALTLLVVSLQVPRTYADLVDTMRGFPAGPP